MCGLVALFCQENFLSHVSLGCLSQMMSALEHRGPDGEGRQFFSQSSELSRTSTFIPQAQPTNPMTLRAFLGHRRLAIIDLSEAGHQPMTDHSSRYWIAFNGEIYNYVELRQQLEHCGYSFHSDTDTEVILNAFAEWGEQCIDHFVGMWAIVIFDTNLGRIFVSRDPFGIKPLYYVCRNGLIAFASEIKSLLHLPKLSRTVDPQGAYDYLLFGQTGHRTQTMFSAVEQIMPAHSATFSINAIDRFTQVRYWQLDPYQQVELSYEAATEKLRSQFLINLSLHSRSDAAWGAALSGGIDSSAIVMGLTRSDPQRLPPLQTISYIASDDAINEEKWVRTITGTANLRTCNVGLQPESIKADLEKIIFYQDEPFGSTSILAQHQVFKAARQQGLKVLLDGQGADELFGGYRVCAAARFASLIRQKRYAQASRFLKNISARTGWKNIGILSGQFLLSPRLQAPLRRLLNRDLSPSWLNQTWMHQANVTTSLYRHSRTPDALKTELIQSLTYLHIPALLRYADRNAMASSVENRVPFLTRELAEFVFTLPESYLISQEGYTKSIFRDAMAGIVPDKILKRTDKIGFSTPEKNLLSGMKPWVDAIFYSD
ncbi:MAG: asparagine synthase (glutamine-hydrolyzing), partial [Cyanobacteria bacterium J06631_9]